MKTFNKLFAVSAAFSLLAVAFGPALTSAPVFADNEEDQAAYEWGFDEGLTTMSSFSSFRFEDGITRQEAAKFLVNGAIALGVDLESDQECGNYTDLGNADASLVSFINQGCEMGIFKDQAKFNPFDVLTREQAELTVARILFGFDAVNDYADDNDLGEFAAARAMLMAEEVVTVNVPGQTAVRRGHLMLMLYRQSDVTPSPVVNPGSAEVSLVSSAGTQNVPYDAVNVKVGTIKLTAGSNGARVSSVVISRDGLADMTTSPDDNRPYVYLQGGNVKTTAKPVSSTTNEMTAKFSPALELAAGESRNFDVVVSLEDAAAVNSTHNFKVTAVNVANGTASGTPISLGTVKTTSAKSKSVTFNTKNGDTTGKAGENKTIAKVEVLFDSAAGTLKGFSLAGATTPDENLYEVFANAKAYVDGSAVGTVEFAKDKVIVSGLNIAKAKDAKVTIEIKADLTYAKSSVAVALSYDSADILEGNTGFGMRANAGGTANITVAGSDITFKKVAIEKDVLPGTSQVKLFAGEIKTATDIVIQKINITPTVSNNSNFLSLLSDGSAVIKINGEVFDLDIADLSIDSTLFSVDTTDLEVGIDAGTTAKVEIIVNTKVPSPLVSASASYSVDLATVESADDSNITYTVAPRAGDTVKIAAGDIKLNKATVAGPTTESLFSNAEQEVGRFSIKANNDSATLKAFDLKDAESALSNAEFGELFDGNLTLVNVANGEDVNATITYNVDTFEVRSMSLNIDKNETVNLKLMANLSSVKDYYGDTVQFEIQANSIVATTSVDDIVTNSAQKLSTNEYTFKVTAPLITMTKNSDNMFKVVIKNIDDDADIDVEDLRFRVRASSDDNNFDGKVCLTDDVSQAECTGTGNNFGTWITDLTLTTINNNDELTTYILVDGASIEPSLLQAQISELKYDIESGMPTVEKYNVVAQ